MDLASASSDLEMPGTATWKKAIEEKHFITSIALFAQSVRDNVSLNDYTKWILSTYPTPNGALQLKKFRQVLNH